MTWSAERVAKCATYISAGKSDKAIARLLGCDRGAVSRYRLALKDDPTGNRAIFWSSRKNARLQTLFERGLSIRDIALKLNMHNKSVSRQLKKLDLVKEIPKKCKFPFGRRRGLLAARRQKLVKKHRDEGLTTTESAKLLKISPETVRIIRKKLDLTLAGSKEHHTREH